MTGRASSTLGARRVMIVGRVVVQGLALLGVLSVWKKFPAPFGYLVLLVPGALFLLDGDLAEGLRASRLARNARLASTAVVCLAAAVSALLVAWIPEIVASQPAINHWSLRPAAVVLTLFVAAQFLRHTRQL